MHKIGVVSSRVFSKEKLSLVFSCFHDATGAVCTCNENRSSYLVRSRKLYKCTHLRHCIFLAQLESKSKALGSSTALLISWARQTCCLKKSAVSVVDCKAWRTVFRCLRQNKADTPFKS